MRNAFRGRIVFDMNAGLLPIARGANPLEEFRKHQTYASNRVQHTEQLIQ